MKSPDDSRQVKMHPDETELDAGLVRALLADQFPQFASLPLKLVRSSGTVNAIFRLGKDLYVRLPRTAAWAGDIDHERNLLPKIGPHISLQIPQPVAKGMPSAGYPYPWTIYRWIEGQPYRDDLIDNERQAAEDLVNFILELRRIDPQDGPPAGRRALGELSQRHSRCCWRNRHSQGNRRLGACPGSASLGWAAGLDTCRFAAFQPAGAR
jgi:aminoglycoside phosphotransferase (APT) family kinase protein